MSIDIVLIVEDRLSRIVAQKLLREANSNYQICNFLYWNKDRIREKIPAINRSAASQAYFALTDQDTHDNCPPAAIEKLHGGMHPNLLYRFAVMEIEAWVMADRGRFSKFLHIAQNKVPIKPDEVDDPKQCVINLARKSRSATIRRELVPRNDSNPIGPGYNDLLGEFVWKNWNIRTALAYSPSLKRAFIRLENFSPTLPASR